MVALSDRERLLVAVAAARRGMAAGAWLGEVGVRIAENVAENLAQDRCSPGVDVDVDVAGVAGAGAGTTRVVVGDAGGPVMQALMMVRSQLLAVRAELPELRKQLVRAGNNLNQVARYAHHTGELPAATATRRVLDAVEQTATRVGAGVADLEVSLGTVRATLPDPTRRPTRRGRRGDEHRDERRGDGRGDGRGEGG